MRKQLILQLTMSTAKFSDLYGSDVFFLLDNSIKVTENNFAQIKENVINFTKELKLGRAEEDTRVIIKEEQNKMILNLLENFSTTAEIFPFELIQRRNKT